MKGQVLIILPDGTQLVQDHDTYVSGLRTEADIKKQAELHEEIQQKLMNIRARQRVELMDKIKFYSLVASGSLVSIGAFGYYIWYSMQFTMIP